MEPEHGFHVVTRRDRVALLRSDWPSRILLSAAASLEYISSLNKDRVTKERRSWNMSRIRGKNTTPEMRVRSLLNRLGYRFRLHVRIPIPVVGTAHGGPSLPLCEFGLR